MSIASTKLRAFFVLFHGLFDKLVVTDNSECIANVEVSLAPSRVVISLVTRPDYEPRLITT